MSHLRRLAMSIFLQAARASRRQIPTLKSLRQPRPGWICQACRAKHVGRAEGLPSNSSTPRKQDKPYYVTTPIFYVNASPHVGHLYSMVIADVLKRWEVLKGREAVLSTGTDEHGLKVQRAAEIQDVPPKTLCDSNAERFRDLAEKANIANDHFIRTTDPEHRDAVVYFWERLRESGYIYETKHEGWYCVSDETFYPENMVDKMIDHATGKVVVASVETGNIVEWTEEKNYHFRLTAFREKLLSFYRENPEWVVPASRFAEVIDWVNNNLEDLSISRPVSRLDWGIPVPDDPSQTIYVWIDALINYITTAGYPAWKPGAESAGGWPADVQVVGKDIMRFHCVYWPALLMALDLPLPKQILSHGHWLMGRQKMSKSIGNVVNPFFAIDRWGVDTMRYFLIYSGGISNDADYNNPFIVEKYKKGLQGGLGNLLNRITRPKQWSIRNAVLEKISRWEDADLLPIVITQRVNTQTQLQKALAQMEKLQPGIALREIMEIVFYSNKWFTDAAPWDRSKQDEVNQIIYHAAETLRIVGILLQPFMPEKSGGLLDRLGVSPQRRMFRDARFHADDDFGVSLVELGKGAQSSLFPPFPVED